MRLILIFLILIPVVNGFFHLFPKPMFDCRRIHSTHCCASRIRAACPALCQNAPCQHRVMSSQPPLIPTPQPSLFTLFPPFAVTSPSKNIGTEGSIGGNPNPFGAIGVSNIDAGGVVGVNPNPFGTIGVPNGFGSPNPEPAVPTPAPIDGFPTLIPEISSNTPSISSFIEVPSETEEKSFVGSNGAIDGEIRAKTGQEFIRVGKKKGILTPPSMPGVSSDELVELVNDEDQTETVPTFVPGPPPPDPPTPFPPIAEPNGFWTPAPVTVKKIGLIPESSDRTTIPVREASGNGLGYWKFAVRPSGYTAPPVQVSSNVTTREIKAKADRTVAVIAETDEVGSSTFLKPENGQQSSIFTEKVGDIIGSFFNNKTIFPNLVRIVPPPLVPSGSPPPLSPPPFSPQSSFTPASPPPTPPIQPPQTPRPQPRVPVLIQTMTQPPPCGVPSDFRPCVSSAEASLKLLECCKRRLMPPGCLELCRYDVTQPEIKRAFDAGKCGILNVAPFLECASAGNNNLECCRHRGVAAKSGLQCEIFCNPAGGLGSLGLQHLTCQNVIGDLLQCHHSGIRP